jgi:hypothetical protein
MARGGTAAAPPRKGFRGCDPGMPGYESTARGGIHQAKALLAFLLVAMATVMAP